MARYRLGTVEIEARQLTRENGAELWEWADSKPWYGPDRQVDGLSIYTLTGRKKADFGDWIVRGPGGDFYPVKDGIFEAAYELLPEAPAEAS